MEVAAAAAAGAHVVRYVYLDCAGGGGVVRHAWVVCGVETGGEDVGVEAVL